MTFRSAPSISRPAKGQTTTLLETDNVMLAGALLDAAQFKEMKSSKETKRALDMLGNSVGEVIIKPLKHQLALHAGRGDDHAR